MEISHKDNGKTGIFYIDQDGERLAEMTYTWRENSILIDHTQVSDVLAGKGIGKQLVDKGVAFAREKHITVVPVCPFVQKILNLGTHYQDILQK